MKKFFAGLFFAIYAGTLAASQDDDFHGHEASVPTGDATRVAAYAQRLRGHVLEPYVSYYQFRPQLESIAGECANDQGVSLTVIRTAR